jgi:hypothetical protein
MAVVRAAGRPSVARQMPMVVRRVSWVSVISVPTGTISSNRSCMNATVAPLQSLEPIVCS